MNRGIVVVNNKCTISRPVLSSLSRIPSRKSTRASNTPQTLTRFRCCTFLAVVCFTAATAFSTTFPLKSSSGKNPVNSHGLPSKQDSPSEGRGQLLQDETTKNNEILAKPTGSTNLIPPPEPGDTSEEINTGEDYSEPLDDTEDEKDGEKMQAAVDYQFKERIQSSVRTVKNWENVEWLEACRKIIPWDELRNSTGPYSNPENDRLLADNSNALFLQRLCRWFPKFMTWVNAPPCVECGCKECEMKTVRGPETEEEKEGNANRVEVYYCPECKEKTTFFPRYNKARKLMDTRRGRCGEYSNLFGLFCRSVGFETRLVLDLSDHLWTEVRIGDNWIMADSCEGVIDKPSMYEFGWGKEGLCYMIAIAPDHVVDVTPRYTRKFLTDDFQMRRRTHTTSENATALIIHELNNELKANLTKAVLDELHRRLQLEAAELQLCKQSTEWTPQEKYGRGRISGSLAWKKSRQEAGENKHGKAKDDGKEREVAGFEVEAFSPPISTTLLLQVRPKPVGRHDGIVVAGCACAVGEANSLSVVVVDEKYLGCILQSKSFLRWTEASDFVSRLPSERIVIMNGKCEEDSTLKSVEMPRLGGWKNEDVMKRGVTYIGQVDARPNWSFCSTLVHCPTNGYEVELQMNSSHPVLKLRSERCTMPSAVAGRLPDSAMPFKTQLLANDEQKRLAFTMFTKANIKKYSGYTTKSGSPVYLLNSTSYPFSRIDGTVLEVVRKDRAWNTFHYLPQPLVPYDDEGIKSKNIALDEPVFEVPLESNFFNTSLGPQLLTGDATLLPTQEGLRNARLVGLYFSAQWCGPCRSFTPMLSEMYAHLKEVRPTHGLEIVFVSSDRDSGSFGKYFTTMPWQAIPFEKVQFLKRSLNMTYGIRGLPSLVVLDAVSGQIVVPANESRQSVDLACRSGEQQIEDLFDSWHERVPQETKEILSMLELSCQDDVVNTEPTVVSENPYILGEPKHSSPVDQGGRIKELFENLVAEGSDPTSAAAKAIGLVAEEQKANDKLSVGSLDRQSLHTGPINAAVSSVEGAVATAKESNAPEAISAVLMTAMKYLRNASKEPWSPKFRQIKLCNKVADQITRVDGGIAILESLGFEVVGVSQEFKAVIPVALDLDATTQKLSRLMQDRSD